MYCDINGKTPSFLNNCLQESLGLESVIIQITLFCSRKTWMLCVELPPEDYSVGHQGMKTGIIY